MYYTGKIGMSNFIQKCISGEARYQEIDDFIEAWHKSNTDLPIYEFLGMTSKEYEMWMKNSDSLSSIIIERGLK